MDPEVGLPYLVIHGAIAWKLALAAWDLVVVAVIGGLAIRRMRRTPGRWPPRAVNVVIPGMLGLVAITYVGYQIEAKLGESYRQDCHALVFSRDPAVADTPLVLSATHVCVLAAAAPGVRDNALEAARDAIEQRGYRDDATMQQMFALTELVNGCDARAASEQRYERYDAAARTAHRCGNRRAEHLALLSQAKLDEAAALPVAEEHITDATADPPKLLTLSALPDESTAIATGRWNDAARAASAAADRLRAMPAAAADAPAAAPTEAPADPATETRARALTALYFRCRAELFHGYAGDQGALPRLRALATGPDGATCAPVLHELVPEAERPAQLARGDDDPLAQSSALLESLAWIDGVNPEPNTSGASMLQRGPEAVLAKPEERIHISAYFTASMWLAGLVPPPTRPGIPPSASVLAWRSVLLVLDGNIPEALTAARAAHARMAETDPHARFNAMVRDDDQLGADVAQDGHELARIAAHDPHAMTTAALGARIAAHGRRRTELDERRAQIMHDAMHAGFDFDQLALLPALVLLHTATTEPAAFEPPADLTADPSKRSLLHSMLPQLLLRRGDPPGNDFPLGGAGLDAARSGAGRPLARHLGDAFPTLLDTELMAVLPRITTDRDAVARQLAWMLPANPPDVNQDSFLFDVALHAAGRRDVLRLAGTPAATAQAAEWDAIYRRAAAVLKDRRKLVALLLWRL